MNWVANEIHFVIACLCQKGVELSLYSCIIGLTLKNIHALLANLWAVFMCFYASIFMQYWNFEYTNTVTLHCGKSGRWYRSCN